MPEKTRLFIADPCHEQWSNMQPNVDGRFCGSCQKTVVDFTMMSDQEILSWLSGADRSVCGRFTDHQLNRDLSPARPPKKQRWLAIWQFLLAGLLVSSEVSAQETAPKPPVTQSDDKPQDNPLLVGKVAYRAIDKGMIKLVIVDEVSGESVPWATVIGAQDHFIADSAGRISIPVAAARRIHKWEISSVGYKTKTVVIHDNWVGKGENVIRLARHAGELLGDVTITGYETTRCKIVTGETTSVTMGAVSVGRKITTLKDALKDTLSLLGLAKKPLTVYPNPVAKGASMTLSVQTGKPGNYLVQLFSNAGALVESMRIEGVDGPRTELLNVPASLAAGLYFVRLLHEQTGKVYTQKVEVM